MSSDRSDRLSEEEAARLWQRAAQLQAEAARRAESAEREEEEGDEPGTDLVRDEGYSLEHVRQAAVEAGIGGEYLDAALADLQVERSLGGRKRGGPVARRFLGDPPDAIVVSRTIDATPEQVLRAMEELVPHAPWRLVLRERQGDPANGGLLFFDIEGAGFSVTEGFTGLASHADLREVVVTIRPAAGRDGAATELTVRGPVAWAQTLNAGIGGFLVTVAGGVGAALSLPLGFGAASLLVAAGVGAAAGTVGFRKLYDWSLGKGRKGLESLVSAIAMKAQGGWGLGTSP